MKVRDLIKLIEKDGWQYMYTTGSHRHFKHPVKPGKVTAPATPVTMSHPEHFGPFKNRRV